MSSYHDKVWINSSRWISESNKLNDFELRKKISESNQHLMLFYITIGIYKYAVILFKVEKYKQSTAFDKYLSN